MSIESVRSKDVFSNLSIPTSDQAIEVPDWVKARGDLSVGEQAPQTFDVRTEATSQPKALKPAIRTKPPTRPRAQPLKLQLDEAQPVRSAEDENGIVGWLKSNTAIGIATSFAMHTLLLIVLGLVVFSNAMPTEEINLFGVAGDSDESLSDSILDTVVPPDAGASAPLAVDADLTATWEKVESGIAVPDSGRMGFGGKGRGTGEAGEGISFGKPGHGVPGHAQTKGSFSAWTDPRDPNPHQNYMIVIQIRVPNTVKKFKGNDLSGMVVGTDGYRQPIKSIEQFPVEDGTVEIRIGVPGAEMRVRDTITIHSKMLKEKQVFEIEF